jgi:hypothetical protein
LLLLFSTSAAEPHHAEGRVDPVDLELKKRNWF